MWGNSLDDNEDASRFVAKCPFVSLFSQLFFYFVRKLNETNGSFIGMRFAPLIEPNFQALSISEEA